MTKRGSRSHGMDRLRNGRIVHYLLLLAVSALLTLPGLGQTSLWDIDEGVNAEAAREMLESGNYIVPKFNFQLRDAKPALLYWCQIGAFRAFGVSEFSARLPSAVAAALAGLLLYELGRAMFSPMAGLLGGIILSSSCLVGAIGRFANPDALLLCCTVLTFLAFWLGYTSPTSPSAGESPRGRWFVPAGIACGLGMLAKGPVALALPGTVIVLFLIWQRQIRLLWDRRLIYGTLAFLLIVVPWFALVTIETRGEFVRGFFLREHFQRFLEPMENHRGQIWYHFAVLPIGFAPWSIFLAPVIGSTVRDLRSKLDRGPMTVAATRFLVCWIVVYLTVFSFAATKLPNYVLPLYPAAALLTARCLERWQSAHIRINVWLLRAGFACMLLIGAVAILGLTLIGGEWHFRGYTGPTVAGLSRWAWIGLIPIAGSVFAWVTSTRQNATAVLGAIAIASVAFVALLVTLPVVELDRHKAIRDLVAEAGTCRHDCDIRLASYLYSQPSLVFYSQREVKQLITEDQVAEFLALPMPAYLFVTETAWRTVLERNPHLQRPPVARKWDLLRRCDVLVVSNQ